MARTVSADSVTRPAVAAVASPGATLARRTALSLAIPVIVLLFWWFASANSTSPFFPPLPDILDRFAEMWLFSQVGSDVIPSLARMFAGFILAIIAGVVFGVMFGRVGVLYDAARPLIHFGRAIPATALLPAAIALLGVGDAMKVVFIAFVCFFPVLMNTIDAVASLDRGMEDVARSFHLTRRQRLFNVLLPFATPQIIAGARVALGIALIMMITSEMLASTNGIGYVTLSAQQAFRIRDMWAGMILLGILGTILNLIFIWAERWLVRWQQPRTEA